MSDSHMGYSASEVLDQTVLPLPHASKLPSHDSGHLSFSRIWGGGRGIGYCRRSRRILFTALFSQR